MLLHVKEPLLERTVKLDSRQGRNVSIFGGCQRFYPVKVLCDLFLFTRCS